MRRLSSSMCAAAFVLLLASSACTRAAATAPHASKIALSPCRLKGSGLPARCGTLTVPEDRAHPEGRRIELFVAVVPALARTPEPDPLFLLAGGPGQAASKALGPVLGAFERVHRRRDLVLVDQRGTGKSHPLDCRLEPEDAPLAERLSDESLPVDKLRACLARWDADPRFYTTAIAMQDLDDVRAALGYDRIDLWGGSYGTRAALVYLRDHGDHVRAAVLDGVAPVQLRLPVTFAPDAQRAIDLLFQGCATSPACSKAYPDLKARFEALIDRLGREPARVRLADPITGAPQDVTISRDTFTGGLRAVLYAPDIAVLVPLIVDHAARGDFGPFAAATTGFSGGFEDTMSLGLMLSVACTEDLPFVTPAEIDELAKGTFLGPRLAHDFAAACSFWPRGTLPPGAELPVRSDKPVLLLSGELDPVTPPRWAELAAKTLPNSRSIVVPGVGHGATLSACMPQVISTFLDTADPQKPDTSCLKAMRRPPFFVSFAGPTP